MMEYGVWPILWRAYFFLDFTHISNHFRLPIFWNLFFQLFIPDHGATARLVGSAVLVWEIELDEPIVVELTGDGL